MNVTDSRMSKRTWIHSVLAICVIVAGLCCPVLSATLDAGQIAQQVSVDSYTSYLQNDLYTHAGDERAYGPKHDLARQRIREIFESFGLTTSLDPFVYNNGTYYNVVGVHHGVTRPWEIYIVGGHYDSVSGSPGAVDNASGVAGVLEAARVMSQYLFEATVIFIAFDREEQGWLGSRAYANAHAQDDIRGMIALDMIAYQPAQPQHANVMLYYHNQPTAIVDDLTATLKTYAGLNAVASPSPTIAIGGGRTIVGISDYVPFADVGFPAALLITYAWQAHPFYHKPSDSLDRLTDADYNYAAQIAKAAVGYLAAHAGIEPVRAVPDFNHDWKVDIEDLTILIEHWGQNDPSFDIAPPPLGDGVVDKQDLEGLMHYWDQEIPDPALAAHWKLDETEGVVALDSVGSADGTLVGDALWQPRHGKMNGALLFDSTDDYVSTPSVLNPSTGPFSVFAWIKGGAPGQVVISQKGGANWLLADASGGRLMTNLSAPWGRFPPKPLGSESVITDGQWHRVGLTWDGSNRVLYIDDVEVARDTQSNLASSGGVLYIGTGGTLAPGSFWSGLIDDVRVYDRAVTP